MDSKIILGDSLEVLKSFESNSIDSLLTDPPAGISFMGKEWDSDKGGRDEWIAWLSSIMKEAYRVMKPGAHGLVWALPRTSHWTATALEDAGFNVRDVVLHLFGQGFPKSHNISKAIDKAAGAEREVVGRNPNKRDAHIKGGRGFDKDLGGEKLQSMDITAPATDAAKQWDGWGTALKPASEHWILIQKPISEKTIASNVLKWGTGAINVDGCRIEAKDQATLDAAVKRMTGNTVQSSGGTDNFISGSKEIKPNSAQGRFPANLVLSHSIHCTESQCDIECAIERLDGQSGVTKGGTRGREVVPMWGLEENGAALLSAPRDRNDSGGASRFFYCAKISSRERNEGLELMPDREFRAAGGTTSSGKPSMKGRDRFGSIVKNHHPTVKPKKLMAYLARLITPPSGTVLDPFMGSGSTGIACKEESFGFIGIELNKEYFEIANKRIEGMVNCEKRL